MADDLELRIARLELDYGDILVVQTDRKPDHELVSSFIPRGVRVLYLPSDVTLSVLTKAEIESKAV